MNAEDLGFTRSQWDQQWHHCDIKCQFPQYLALRHTQGKQEEYEYYLLLYIKCDIGWIQVTE